MTTSTSRRSSSSAWTRVTPAGTVHVAVSTRAHGDFHLDRVPPDELARRQRRFVDLPWTMPDEVHGTTVVPVDAPGAADRSRGDVLVADVDAAALGIWVGDCAPVAIVSERGAFAVAHAGWRGLAAGVLDAACDALGLTAVATGVPEPARAYLGACIGPCCYEFGAADLATVASAVGVSPSAVTATTTWGTPALDLPAAVTAALARRGVAVEHSRACTGCGGVHFSHRMGSDPRRHVLVAWRTPGEVARPRRSGPDRTRPPR